MSYVIFLSSKNNLNDASNAYGYWTGRDYTVAGYLYPETERRITKSTKRYTSKERAKRGLDVCLNRGYAYVLNGEVRKE